MNADPRMRFRTQSEPAAPAPAPEPVDDGISLDSAAAQYADPVLRMIMALQEPVQEALAGVADALGSLRKENRELRLALAELKAEHAETKAQLGVAAHKLERMTITHKGDPGERGPPGADGRDGAQGPRGEKGNRGQRGFETTGWLIDHREYTVTPLFYDNSQGPTLNLRSLFEQAYLDGKLTDDVTQALEENEADEAARAEDERRSAARRGLPAR
jgi:hypothetical protein